MKSWPASAFHQFFRCKNRPFLFFLAHILTSWCNDLNISLLNSHFSIQDSTTNLEQELMLLHTSAQVQNHWHFYFSRVLELFMSLDLFIYNSSFFINHYPRTSIIIITIFKWSSPKRQHQPSLLIVILNHHNQIINTH